MSSDEDEPHIQYSEREAWSDVTPIKQQDGDNPVVKILYTPQFEDAYDYFRAILHTGEKSERALELTEYCLKINAANYTVWQYRREILKALNSDLHLELAYITAKIQSTPKNYQVWYHRQVIVEWMGSAGDELAFITLILDDDGKNYHAWQHRQWVVETFGLWQGEIEFTDHLLEMDIRNNSAWNHRFFVISKTTGFTPETITREIKYTTEIIEKARNNESPWNFLRGVLSKCRFSDYPVVEKFCDSLYNSKCKSPYLLSLLADLYLEKQAAQASTGTNIYLDKALKMYADLSGEFDTIRSNYWNFMGKRMEAKYRIPPAEPVQ